jgi:hypothetical protein
MNLLRRGSRPRRLVALAAVAVAGIAVFAGAPGGPAPGGAVDRYRAGEPASVRSAVPAEAAAAVRSRGLAAIRALGLPAGATTQIARVVDRFSTSVVDEVVTTDRGGQRLSLVQVDGAGRVSLAVRLGWTPPTGQLIQKPAVAPRAAALAAAAGIPLGASSSVAASLDGGWQVTWPRFVGDVPVPGDGAVVTLFTDGSFHAAAHRERSLAPAPATTMPRDAAERAAQTQLATLLGPQVGDARIAGSHLAWVAPNDAFDASAPDAPDPVLRLAWVVEARAAGTLAEQLQAMEVYLDAGDGRLLGGDTLR